MKDSKLFRLSLIGLVVVSLSALFHNCSYPEKKDGSAQPTGNLGIDLASQNGEGYRGKLTYVNRGSCGTSIDVRSRIEVVDGKTASVLRENCVDVVPYPIDPLSLAIMPYNLDHALRTDRLFDREATAKTTTFLCRGTEPFTWANGTLNGKPVQVSADLILVSNSGNWTAQVKLGWLDTGGILLASRSTIEFPVRLTAFGNFEDYQGGDLLAPILGGPQSGITSFDLAVNRAGVAPYNGSITMILADSIQLPNNNKVSFASVNVKCYPQ